MWGRFHVHACLGLFSTVSYMFSDFLGYAKWFALHNYDYAVYSKSEMFTVIATSRDSLRTVEGELSQSPQQAMSSCYIKAKIHQPADDPDVNL